MLFVPKQKLFEKILANFLLKEVRPTFWRLSFSPGIIHFISYLNELDVESKESAGVHFMVGSFHSVLSVSDFEEFLNDRGLRLVYSSNTQAKYFGKLTIEKKHKLEGLGYVKYKTNTDPGCFIPALIIGDENYIHHLVFCEMLSKEIKISFFENLPSISINGKKSEINDPVYSKSDIIECEGEVLGSFFSRRYTYRGFVKYLKSRGYQLNDDFSLCMS
jgi:hypothetical protein